MEKYSFFDSVNGDRKTMASDFARHLKNYFTNGIFNNGLRVSANNNMTISLHEGDANIEGYRYTNTTEMQKEIELADGALNRIDNVVLRLDLVNRLISAQIIKGDFAENPVAPNLVRNTTIYDLRLAKIYVPAGATEITPEQITDCRFDSNDCGNVVGAVQQLDTTDIFVQYENIFFNWFERIKGQLSTDVAGNLQRQINDLANNKIGLDWMTDDETEEENLLYTSGFLNRNMVKAKNAISSSEKDTYCCSFLNLWFGDLESDITNLRNGIISSGSNANGRYIDFIDGTRICTKRVTGTAQITATWGHLYDTGNNSIDFGAWAKPFTEKPIISLQFVGGNGQWVEGIADSSATQVGRVSLASATSKTPNIAYDVIGIGRWK